MNPPVSEREAYQELQCYTLSHPDRAFIHQHIVDAWAAQNADEHTKPITLAFALVGLYLHVERGVSGRNVQRVHMELARSKQDWPSFILPQDRGRVTASRVVTAPAGPERDQMIDAWCRSVWDAYRENHEKVADLLSRVGTR